MSRRHCARRNNPSPPRAGPRPSRRRNTPYTKAKAASPQTPSRTPKSAMRSAMPDEHQQQRRSAAQTVGQAAEKEAPGGAAHADRAEQQNGRGLRHAMIERVRNEMDEGDEYPERANQAGGVQTDEAPRPDRLPQRKARRSCRRGADCSASPSGPSPRSRGSFSISSASPDADDGGKNAEHQVGVPPPQSPMRNAASGGMTRVPTPIPLTARPEAKPRRWTNQRCTAPNAGT